MALTGEWLEVRDRIADFYLRTAPGGEQASGVLVACPNHCTPASLVLLLYTLEEVRRETRDELLRDASFAAAVAALQGPLFASPSTTLAQTWNDLARLNDRLSSYLATAQKVAQQAGPDVQACLADTDPARRLLERVVLPLFFGQFPSDLEPFASQPPPWNGQGGDGLSDLSATLVLARTAGLEGKLARANLEQLGEDLEQATGDTLELVAQAGGLVGAALVGFGVWSLARALRRR